MASIPFLSNPLHSRHIRSAYQRRRDEAQNGQNTNVLQRSRSSQARLEHLAEQKEPEQHKHHHHHKHHTEVSPKVQRRTIGQYEHLKHHKLHEKPIFALSLEAERMALRQLSLPSTAPRKERHWLSAPELSVECSQRPVVHTPRPVNGWKLDIGAYRSYDISPSGFRRGIVDAIQTFANAPTA